MQKLIINGGTKLKGEVQISGSKNAVLPIAVAAAILGDSLSVLHNVPNLTDVKTLSAVLEGLGASITRKNESLYIEPINRMEYEAPYELVRQMRASIYVLGPLVAKLGKAKVSFPGGCAIGPRPVDLHIRGLEQLGADVDVKKGYIFAQADRLVGADMDLTGQHGPSVGATANVMMAATLADGTTVIRGAAREPHISDLAKFLTAMGADIEGIGTSVLTIRGVKQLHGTEHTVVSDDIEAGTFMVAGAITNGNVFVRGISQQQIPAISEKLTEAGVHLEWNDKGVWVTVPDQLKAIDVTTVPFPGFPTDMQAQIMGLMTLASGSSTITENVHTDRFIHAAELNRMGADIRLEGRKAIVNGVSYLSGAPVMASDLRAGAVLVVAGMAAVGETVVSRIYHIDRGYEAIETKLNNLGANIVRVKDND
ncbi:MAG: UDP-N-acetylglucosamine 1-carboxyvinyltransferase [Candidatus Poribacteria bacterium]|nr:UDP-N-acetylglucosamine 1-carboxyvinyltransferase [Candidatus Poribacteria bacterium]